VRASSSGNKWREEKAKALASLQQPVSVGTPAYVIKAKSLSDRHLGKSVKKNSFKFIVKTNLDIPMKIVVSVRSILSPS